MDKLNVTGLKRGPKTAGNEHFWGMRRARAPSGGETGLEPATPGSPD
jgi:hypothetical protein